MQGDLQRLLYTLKFCGIDEKYLAFPGERVFDLKYVFIPNDRKRVVIGGLENIVLTTTDNMSTCVDIDLSIHQNESLKCIRCIPGDTITGGPRWFLVIDYDVFVEGKIIFFEKSSPKNVNIERIIKIFCPKAKKEEHLEEYIYPNKLLLNRIISFPVFSFHYKHGTIMSRIQNVLISKEDGKQPFIYINLDINTNKNLKSIRRGLWILNEWEIFSSYGSGRKIYKGEIFLY